VIDPNHDDILYAATEFAGVVEIDHGLAIGTGYKPGNTRFTVTRSADPYWIGTTSCLGPMPAYTLAYIPFRSQARGRFPHSGKLGGGIQNVVVIGVDHQAQDPSAWIAGAREDVVRSVGRDVFGL